MDKMVKRIINKNIYFIVEVNNTIKY